MKEKMIVYSNKSLRLDNVLIKQVINTLELQRDLKEKTNEDTIELIVTQMENQIKSKGANTIGPIIQYSGPEFSNEEMGLRISLMLQADRYIHNVDPGFRMEPVIKKNNCMYVRFEGSEEDLQIAYKKIQVEAYENDIILSGNSYTVFVDDDENDDESIMADIFMEKEE